jgi:hypothetical protein
VQLVPRGFLGVHTETAHAASVVQSVSLVQAVGQSLDVPLHT